MPWPQGSSEPRRSCPPGAFSTGERSHEELRQFLDAFPGAFSGTRPLADGVKILCGGGPASTG